VSEAERSKVFGGDGPLALCLSGGGFRAMFFHLGVVRLLQELGCLKRVTHVFSVSGGSILAAHLSTNWVAYTSGSESSFQRLSDELVQFGRDDLRGKILRRWILSRSRAATLQRQYDKFFKGVRLRELPSTPTFYFLTTSMTTGRLCAFTRDAFLVVHEDGRVARHPAEAQPVAQAVAASSAFPPLFPPLQLELPDLPRAQFPIAEYLTDGGIFDNLGISRLHRLVSEATKAGFVRIIVSDASALFDHAPDSRFLLLPSRASRATDILMQRVASLESELWQREPGDRLKVLGIGDVVADLPMGQFYFRPQSQKIQRLLKGVRTDFDAFELDLIRALVQHGHDGARLLLKLNSQGPRASPILLHSRTSCLRACSRRGAPRAHVGGGGNLRMASRTARWGGSTGCRFATQGGCSRGGPASGLITPLKSRESDWRWDCVHEGSEWRGTAGFVHPASIAEA
jgi:predicted acylesterase/phospholipase RssA